MFNRRADEVDEYAERLRPVLEDMVASCVREMPSDALAFMHRHLQQRRAFTTGRPAEPPVSPSEVERKGGVVPAAAGVCGKACKAKGKGKTAGPPDGLLTAPPNGKAKGKGSKNAHGGYLASKLSSGDRAAKEADARRRSLARRQEEQESAQRWRGLRAHPVCAVPWATVERTKWCPGGMGGATLMQVGENDCVVLKSLGLNAVAEVLAVEVAELLGVRVAASRPVAADAVRRNLESSSPQRPLDMSAAPEFMELLGAMRRAPMEGATREVMAHRTAQADFVVVMEFVSGSVLQEGMRALRGEELPSVLRQLGTIIALDCVLNNVDRIPAIWFNEGNLTNVMVTAEGVVGIDQQVNAIGNASGKENYFKILGGFCQDCVQSVATGIPARRIATAILDSCGVELEEASLKLVLEGASTVFQRIMVERNHLTTALKALDAKMHGIFGRASTEAGLSQVEKMTDFLVECVDLVAGKLSSPPACPCCEEPREATRQGPSTAVSARASDLPKTVAAKLRSSMDANVDECANLKCAGLAMFDFDQTLACYHVYGSVAGSKDNHHIYTLPVPAPFAHTELGQLRRVVQYDEEQHFSAEGGFAFAAFGGPERVNLLLRCFQELKTRGVQLVLCSNCYVAPMQKVLADVGLLDVFDRIYGRLGHHHCKENLCLRRSTHVDVLCQGDVLTAQDMKLMGKPEHGDWDSKVVLLNSLKKERGLEKHQVVLIEDDESAIRAAGLKISETLLVNERGGLTAENCETLLVMFEQTSDLSGDAHVPPAIARDPETKKGTSRAEKAAAIRAKLAEKR